MALSYGVERPTTGFGGDVQYTTPVLGDARLPEAEPKFTSFLPSAEEVRKRKLQDEMMLGNEQRDQQIAQLIALMKGPMETMGYGDMPVFDALRPERQVEMANRFGSLDDMGFGLGVLDPGTQGQVAHGGFGMGNIFR